MSWKDDYRQAKFRNAEFFVPESGFSGGRRGAIHEFPKQDEPYVEDMGRSARKFSLDAYVLGDDYRITRDELIVALEKPGSGKLVHPYYGTLEVFCTNWSIRESRSELSIARFTLSFVEAGSLKFPLLVEEPKTIVQARRNTALQKLITALNRIINALDHALNVVQNLADTVDQALDTIELAKQVVSTVAEFRKTVEDVKNRVDALIYDMQALGQDITDLVTFGTNEDDSTPVTADNARQQFDEMRSMFDFEPAQLLSPDDPSTDMAQFIQQTVLLHAIGLTSYMTFSSVGDATIVRDELLAKLETYMLSTDDDELYRAYYDLSVAFIKDLDARIATLPRIIEYTPTFHVPSMVLSYRLYGDIDHEQDIIDRNSLQHPGFIPAAVPLEVLTDE